MKTEQQRLRLEEAIRRARYGKVTAFDAALLAEEIDRLRWELEKDTSNRPVIHWTT